MLTSDMGITEATTMRASWLIDGSGACAASDVTLRLRAGRVAAVEHGTAAETSSPAEERLDLGGWTLIPWLLDAHVHLFMTSTSDPEVRRKQLDSTYDGLLGSMKSNAAALLRAGVLAARDGGDYGGYSLRLRDEGLPGCPLRICSPGRAFRARGRYGRLIGRSPGEGESLAEAIRLELEERRPNHVKVVQSGLNSLVRFGRVTRPQFDLGQLREAVAVATRRGTPVMAHANGPAAVAIAIEAGCASVEHGFFMGEEALKRLAESHCVWVPTAVTMKGYAEQLPAGDSRRDVALQNLEHQLEQIARGRELGVTIACGTDAGTLGVSHGESVATELALLHQAGFGLEEAIAAASSIPASLLGLEGEVGRISPGRSADFLAYSCSPTELLPSRLSRPNRAWLRGVEVSLEALGASSR